MAGSCDSRRWFLCFSFISLGGACSSDLAVELFTALIKQTARTQRARYFNVCYLVLVEDDVTRKQRKTLPFKKNNHAHLSPHTRGSNQPSYMGRSRSPRAKKTNAGTGNRTRAWSMATTNSTTKLCLRGRYLDVEVSFYELPRIIQSFGNMPIAASLDFHMNWVRFNHAIVPSRDL